MYDAFNYLILFSGNRIAVTPGLLHKASHTVAKPVNITNIYTGITGPIRSYGQINRRKRYPISRQKSVAFTHIVAASALPTTEASG